MLSYQKKLLASFAGLFAVFAIVLVAFQWQRERDFREELLEARLQGYADIISTQDTIRPLNTVDSVRTTIILTTGRVLYESNKDISAREMSNHINRREVRTALAKGEGHDIRKSATTGEEFFYYAKRYGNRIVRVALPFNLSVRHFIRSGSNVYIWVSLLAFAVTFSVLIFLSDRFGRTVSDVKRRERAKTRDVKRQMSNNITHELRTPVAAIHGYIETLVRNPSLPEQTRQHFLNRALMQSERLADLIRDVSIISKTEEAPDMLPREDLCLNDIVRDVEEELHQSLVDAHVRFTASLPADVHLHGNYSLVYSIIRNLVENTIRYAGAPAASQMAAQDGGQGEDHAQQSAAKRAYTEAIFKLESQTSTHYNFLYWDNGPGVGEQHLPRIFERFYRVDEGRTRGESESKGHDAKAGGMHGGTGLGLSIVKNAVLFHHGQITAQNRPEGGLLFHFTLHK